MGLRKNPDRGRWGSSLIRRKRLEDPKFKNSMERDGSVDKCLPVKLGDLSLVPRTHTLGEMVCIYAILAGVGTG